jgi:hypothetical protein
MVGSNVVSTAGFGDGLGVDSPWVGYGLDGRKEILKAQ